MTLRLGSLAGAVALTVLLTGACDARPVSTPFDFSRSVIALNVSVHGTPLFMMLDTGVTPSAIDTARAKSLGLKIDYKGGGEGSGSGDANHVMVYPTTIDDLKIGAHKFAPIVALAADYSAISHAFGRRVDGTLGYSFLNHRVTLIDFDTRTLTVSGQESGAMKKKLAACHRAWRLPLSSFKGDIIPVVDMKIAGRRVPVSIDTGSNGNVELYQHALDIPEIKAALVQSGTTKQTGARGEYTAKVYHLNAPVSLGPFTLPAGQRVTLSSNEGSATTRLANVGDKLLAAMHIKLLLDYRDRHIGFYGACPR